MNKLRTILCLLTACAGTVMSQTAPVKHFSLKKEPTQIPADSLGTTWFYSVSFESTDTLSSVVFKLTGLSTDSVHNTQTFNLPQNDGIYQTGFFPNGLIKDRSGFFILLGNVKSAEDLILISDFNSL